MRCFIFLISLLAAPAWANDWDALRQPGAIAIMRHALAPGTGDPAGFTLGDCATQRNLNDAGRAQARRTGDALRTRGISFDAVLTSQWCRARETARLLDLGTPVDAPALNSFFRSYDRRDAQTDALIEQLRTADGPLMLVTHQVNITALTGRGVRSGEIIVFRLTPDGVMLLGSILIDP